MAELADYLELTEEAATRQWRAIRARRPKARQDPFTPVETLLCLAAMAIVNHRSYGGSTARFAPTPVPELAALFVRPPSSILAKQANLDGSRANGARHEVETAQRRLADPAHLTSLYRKIFDAARAAGIGPGDLPDFLLLDDVGDLEYLGQERLTADALETAIEADRVRLSGHMTVPDLVTERLLIAAVRIGQHRFATSVLGNYGHACGFCGMRPGPGLERRGMLRASHIKAWSSSTSAERLDPSNGIAACPTHDAAFDRGLLWVNGGYRIHHAEALSDAVATDEGVRAAFGRPPLAEALLVAGNPHPPRRQYLEWHRSNVAA